MPRPFPRRSALAWVAAVVALSGCYDSSWGQAKKNQQSVAQARTPQTLHGTRGDDEAGPSLLPTRVVRIRAHATPRHAAEVTDWTRRLADMLEDANRVLAPTLAIRLELAEATGWSPRAPDDTLLAVLDELATADPGDDVDWVVGLTGSVPRFEESFHELGMAKMSGKHLVLRAVNDAREYEAIERGFPDLDASERSKLFLTRKRHKRATVMLHELGHTLGVPHQPDKTAIMTPRYDIAVEAYGQPATDLMRLALDDRRLPEAQRDSRAVAEGVLAVLQRTADRWVPTERDEMIRRIEAQRGVPRPVTSATEAAAPVGDALSALSAADRGAYDRALEWQKKDRAREAWAESSPLFAAYPELAPIQDLRCQLAMKLKDWQEAKKDCARLMPTGKRKVGDPKRK